ncbi:MAG: serpin family protein [Chlamydiota bacterium]
MLRNLFFSLTAAATMTVIGSATANDRWPPMEQIHQQHGVVINDSLSVMDEVVKGNTSFAFDINQQIAAKENFFVSPLSISAAMSMLYEGAHGVTADEIQQTMHFLPYLSDQGNGYDILLSRLSDREDIKLHLANALWGQTQYSFLSQYENILSDDYHAHIYQVDFVKQPEEAVQKINNWVEEQTSNRIKDILSLSDVGELTRLVLTNAIYFKGAWDKPFNEENTVTEPFHLSSWKSIEASMMNQTDYYPYYAGDDFTAIEMPYKGKDLSMVVFLPDDIQGLENLEAKLDSDIFQECLENMSSKKVRVKLPKFRMESKMSLASILENMGIEKVFTSSADLSGINGKQDLSVSKVIHQTFIDVDEHGTEAAAATAVVANLTSTIGAATKEFYADHPFIFFIIDRPTKAVLFMGKVYNPEN